MGVHRPCKVKAYNRKRREPIHQDKTELSAIISQYVLIGEAPQASKNFGERVEGWHKVVLHPDTCVVPVSDCREYSVYASTA